VQDTTAQPNHPPRNIRKVATDLRAVVIIEAIDPAKRTQWPLGDQPLPKSKTKHVSHVVHRGKLSDIRRPFLYGVIRIGLSDASLIV